MLANACWSRGVAVALLLTAAGLALAQSAPGGDAVLSRRSAPREMPAPGQRVDLAAFGAVVREGGALGVEWVDPREVGEVRVAGVSDAQAAGLKLEWWGSIWPGNGGGGWMRLDDPWNGRWVRVATQAKRNEAGAWAFTFPPLSREEWDQEPRPPLKEAPTYRKTLKVRAVAEGGSLPADATLAVLGQSRWAEAGFDVELLCPGDGATAGHIEVTNGVLANLSSLPAPRAVMVEGPCWHADKIAGQSAGVRIGLVYTVDGGPNSNDRTRVTVRLGKGPTATGFSFVPQDVIQAGGAMRLPAFGALVAESWRGLTLANDPGPPRDAWRYPVRQRLTERPEMTHEMATAAIPRLRSDRWAPLGVPSARQEVFVSPNGDWSFWNMSIGNRYPEVFKAGRDSQRVPFHRKSDRFDQEKLDTFLDTQAEPRFDARDREQVKRYLQDGHLPLIHVEWQTGPIRYHHALVATALLGDYGDDVGRRGDETVVLLSKLEVTNTANTAKPAFVNLRYLQNTPIALEADGAVALRPADRSLVPEGLSALRGQISMDRPAGGGAEGWTVQPGQDPICSDILRWQATLEPKQTRTIYFKAPFVDLLEADELRRLREISLEDEAPRVLDYWRQRLARNMQIEVPDAALNDLYQANLWHIVITTDRDPITGLYNQGVGTVQYAVFGNETVMIARSMDMRGEHLEGERFLEPMLHFQGEHPLKGRFSTKEGVFHSAGPYTQGEYAMNHGFVMWGVADHYLMTRDRAYLERVAPKLIAGCDFLIKERRATMSKGEVRSPIHGLSPASSLEDVVEYQYWFSTNGYFHLGMKRVAEALADIGHPEAERIAREAEAYRRDIESAVREAATKTAAVPLRDGTFIPYVPSRAFQWRHLTEGWIREALYPALQLATAEVVSADDPLITWMLDDLEDNIFFSGQSGFGIDDCERAWFEHGGLTLQPCLLDMPPTYLARGEIQAALRSFWNTYAASVYPDVHCFAEWVPQFGEGGGPLYKTSDEARFVIWLRQLLVWEDGERLWLGRGAPRAWLNDGQTIRVERAATRFGPVSLTIESQADAGLIRARVEVSDRGKSPGEVWLRLRHPGGARPSSVTVNGRALGPEAVVGEDIRLWPGAFDRSVPVEVVARYSAR